MKLTKEQIVEIKKLKEAGKTLRELAEIYKVSFSTIAYHLNPESRKESSKNYWGKLTKEQRSEIYKRYSGYKRRYMRKRYSEDKEFREKMKKKSRDYYKEKKNESNNIQ